MDRVDDDDEADEKLGEEEQRNKVGNGVLRLSEEKA
jgi:hypothetical protein